MTRLIAKFPIIKAEVLLPTAPPKDSRVSAAPFKGIYVGRAFVQTKRYCIASPDDLSTKKSLPMN
jgi:hypothetical protein